MGLTSLDLGIRAVTRADCDLLPSSWLCPLLAFFPHAPLPWVVVDRPLPLLSTQQLLFQRRLSKRDSALGSQPHSLSYGIVKQIWAFSGDLPCSALQPAHSHVCDIVDSSHCLLTVYPEPCSACVGDSGLCKILRTSSLLLHVSATTVTVLHGQLCLPISPLS